MGKLHLNFGPVQSGGFPHAAIAPRTDPDQRRADLMAARFIEGLKTLPETGRKQVLDALAREFGHAG